MVLLFLMLLILIAGKAGFPVPDGNPLPGGIRKWVQEHPDSVLCGETASVRETEGSVTILLNNSYLIFHSLKYPVKNVQISFKREVPETVVPGTLLVVSGKLEEFAPARNPGEYDRKQYMACRHCYYQIRDARILQTEKSGNPVRAFLFSLKDRFTKVIRKTAGEDAAEFLAIALGDRTELEDETRMLYQMAGILHIFVISGLHISVIGLGLYEFLLRKLGLGIRLSGLFSMSVLLLYGMMTGGGISTMRAVSMFLLLILSRILGRIYDMLTALAFSGILLLLESPGYLYDSGFLLSFSAVAGTAVLYPCLTGILDTCISAVIPRRMSAILTKRSGSSRLKPVILTLSVQLAALPVILHTYGEISLTGPVLNLLIIPTSGILLISAVTSMIAGSIFLPAGIAASFPGRVMLDLYRFASGITGYFPFRAWIPGEPGRIQTIVYLILLTVPVCLGESLMKCGRQQRTVSRRRKKTVWACCVGSLILAVAAAGCHCDQEIKVTVLDIGQGSCAVAETRRHHAILLDGGSTSKEKIGQYQLLPFLKNQGIGTIDAAFVSHTDNDHISGIVEILELQEKHLGTIRLNTLIVPDWNDPPEAYTDLIELAKRAGAEVCCAASGDLYRNGEVICKILSPDPGLAVRDINEDGMVVRLEYGKFSMLFPGDIGEDTEKKLIGKLEDTDVLLAPHHGSAYSGCGEFLEAVQPELAVISCAENNVYGHPSPDAVARLQNAGARILYTMKGGAVMIRTGGNGEYQAQTFLKPDEEEKK